MAGWLVGWVAGWMVGLAMGGRAPCLLIFYPEIVQVVLQIDATEHARLECFHSCSCRPWAPSRIQ